MKILVIGDLHFKDRRGYADYIEDGRESEQDAVLDFIVSSASDCDTVVMLGDQLNSKNNSSAVITRFVNFVERFKDKKVYIIQGNHEKWADGRGALNFMSEIKGKHWSIFTNKPVAVDGLVFCPFFSKEELGCEDHEEATQKVLSMLPDGDYFFAHHGVTGAKSRLMQVSLFEEVVIPADFLEKKYKKSFFGHIHEPQGIGLNIVGTGSVFCDEAGEEKKYIWKLDTSNNFIDQIPIPARGVFALENPTMETLTRLAEQPHNIAKVVLTEHGHDIDELKKILRKFDAFVLLEQYPAERRKLPFTEDKNILSMEVEELLEIYAKQNKLDPATLIKGWNIIKTYEN